MRRRDIGTPYAPGVDFCFAIFSGYQATINVELRGVNVELSRQSLFHFVRVSGKGPRESELIIHQKSDRRDSVIPWWRVLAARCLQSSRGDSRPLISSIQT